MHRRHPSGSLSGFSLIETMIALSLIAIASAALFSTYSSSFRLIASQQDTIAVTACLQERLDQARSQAWTNLTTAPDLQKSFLTSATSAGAGLPGLVEELTVSLYPPPATVATPLRLRRAANGDVTILSQPGNTALRDSTLVRVDLRATWQRGGRPHVRETSALLAQGGKRS